MSSAPTFSVEAVELFERPVKLRMPLGCAVLLTESHCAEADSGHLRPTLAKLNEFHRISAKFGFCLHQKGSRSIPAGQIYNCPIMRQLP